MHLYAVPDGDDSPSGAVRAETLEDLLRASARGDEAAFARLYDATASRLFGLVLRVVRNRAHAEEVTQEVYLDVWRHCASFDPAKGSGISWMMTVAHRRAVDRVRVAEAAGRRDQAYQDKQAEVPTDTTSETAHARLDAARVREAVSGLTDVQREAVTLAYFGGYTHTEVAALLGLPLGTAKTRIRDGLIRLRDSLDIGKGSLI